MMNWKLILVVAFVVLASGCASSTNMYVMKVTANDPVIELYDKNISGTDCVKKTRTKVKNCNKHQDDETCNKPGDTITWQWKKTGITQKFKIVAKEATVTSPFTESTCGSVAATTVVCTIKASTDSYTFYDYTVVVDPTVTNCDLDPRILIY